MVTARSTRGHPFSHAALDAANPEDLFPTHVTIPAPSAAHSSREKETQPRLSLSPSLSPWFLAQRDDTHTRRQHAETAVATGKEQGGMERAAEESGGGKACNFPEVFRVIQSCCHHCSRPSSSVAFSVTHASFLPEDGNIHTSFFPRIQPLFLCLASRTVALPCKIRRIFRSVRGIRLCHDLYSVSCASPSYCCSLATSKILSRFVAAPHVPSCFPSPHLLFFLTGVFSLVCMLIRCWRHCHACELELKFALP